MESYYTRDLWSLCSDADEVCTSFRMMYYCCKEHQVLAAMAFHKKECAALKQSRAENKAAADLASIRMPEDCRFEFQPNDFAVLYACLGYRYCY